MDRYGEPDVNCEEAKNLIHPLIDGELDAYNAAAVEAHAESCAGCAAELSSLRDLQTKIASARLRYHAPESLRRQIDRVLPQPAARPSRREWLKGFAFGAGLSAVAASGAFLFVIRNDADQRILGDVVSAHLRSLEPDHLTNVLSSDRHTVKPWFNGRLDVAPPVIDLTAEGFNLIGGRLDAIGGKMVAAIVYKKRAHIINLFVAPGASEARPATLEKVQGFNIRRWAENGLALWAISDINAGELDEFGAKFDAAVQKGR
jgi:anti-sigma factor RsiW